MPVYAFEGKRPKIASSAFVYPEATIIGDVVIGEGCYIGPGARIRGDWGSVIVGANSNIQENCIIHSAPNATTLLSERSHIGHGSILHGPFLEEHVEVGMGAIIMDNVKIGAGSCIGAGAVVIAGTIIPPRRLYIGVPAKDAGKITEERARYMDYATGVYIKLPPRCFQGLVQLDIEDVIV
ncbi:MAG TPA: gamma carbonic anhydrase family protein [Firmicutes bacterium]|jgi:phenylacetic acid degradation protein|nr:gamma carbonic anhydrase family protein [Bacillota bacterium]